MKKRKDALLNRRLFNLVNQIQMGKIGITYCKYLFSHSSIYAMDDSLMSE